MLDKNVHQHLGSKNEFCHKNHQDQKIIMYNFTISCIKSSNHSIKTFNSFITTSSKVLLNIILNDSYRYLKFL